MKVIRRPFVSDIGPQNEGANPWTIIYVVIVKLTSDKLTPRSFVILVLVMDGNIKGWSCTLEI